jgi:hypothetical protein
MSTVTPPTAPPTNYFEAASRHYHDAILLKDNQRDPNAGQLFGFCVECGLKEMLLACGAERDATWGGVAQKSGFRAHLPTLDSALLASAWLLPNGARAGHYRAFLPNADKMANWSVDQRYYAASALPQNALNHWQTAADEALGMLDQILLDGVL